MKKTLLSLIIMCFMAISVVLAGCSPKGLEDNPPTDANVISNGGMTVVKGDYLYYINGYIDETTLTKDDNKYGKVNNSAIYRTKLVNGEIEKDEDGFVIKTEVVVPKIVGFSNGGFYIMGDYIYYTTPYMNLDRNGTLQNDRVEFHRININGTDDKVLYTTSTNEDNLDWTLYNVNNTVYIATYVSKTLIVINTSDKSVKEIANVASYALLQEPTYRTDLARTSEFQNNIYFTYDTSAGNLEYGVHKLNIATGNVTKETKNENDQYAYTIKYVNTDRVYYTKKDTTYNGLDLLFAKKITTNWFNATEESISDVTYDSYFFCNFGNNLVIASNSNGTFLLENMSSKQVSASKRTILAVNNEKAYYVDSEKLYRFDIRGEIENNEITPELVTDESKTHIITNSKYLDFDYSRVYVYCNYTSANSNSYTYLNYVQPDKTERFVGEFEDAHLPAEPEQDEDSEEDIPHID